MRKVVLIGAALGLFAGVAVAGEMPWAKDWADAQKQAKASGKLIMLDFFTEWCGWCKKLDADVYTNETFIKQAAQVVPLKLDAEKEGKDLAKKYNVRGYPTILFVDAAGEVMGKIGGYEPLEQFTTDLNKQVTGYKEFPKLQEGLKKNPDDGELNAKMASILASRGRAKEAEACLHKAERAGYGGAALAPAYNAIGDVYQQGEGGKPDVEKAIGLFKKGDAVAKNPKDRSYAKISLVYCHYMAGDKEAAKKACNELIEMKDADPEYVKMAKDLLKQLDK